MSKTTLLFNPKVIGSGGLKASSTFSVSSTAAVTIASTGVFSAASGATTDFNNAVTLPGSITVASTGAISGVAGAELAWKGTATYETSAVCQFKSGSYLQLDSSTVASAKANSTVTLRGTNTVRGSLTIHSAGNLSAARGAVIDIRGTATFKNSSVMNVQSGSYVEMKTGALLSANGGVTAKMFPKVLCLDITSADLNIAGATQSASFGAAIPAYSWLQGAILRTVTPFTKAAAISNVTICVGTAGDPDGAILSVAIGTGCTSGIITQASQAAFFENGGHMFSAATTLKALIKASGGNLNTISAGQASVYLMYFEKGIGSAVP